MHWNRFFSAVLLKRHQEAWAGVSFSLPSVPLQIRALREALKDPGLKDKFSTGQGGNVSSRMHKVGREGTGNRFVFCWAPLCLTRVLGLWMFGEGRLIRIHRVRENPRTTGQHFTYEKQPQRC